MDIVFRRWPGIAPVGAVAAVCVAGLLVFEWVWDAPQREALAARSQALQLRNLELDGARQAAGRLPALEAAVAELRLRFSRLSARLPARRDASALLRRLEIAAARSNLTIRAFVPQAAAERSWYAEWPIHLELTGTYQRLGLFFDRVSRFDRIINLQDIAIRALEPSRPNETIAAECTATTFVLHETSPHAEPAGVRGAGQSR